METVRMETAMETHFMAKMGKWMTPEEEARQKFIMRERDRERKRIKRLNPEYRQMERERDRFRKLTPRPSLMTPEEEARHKFIMRERDRERKRIKRLNPEYRRMERERDRFRKKARRANVAFFQYTILSISLSHTRTIAHSNHTTHTHSHGLRLGVDPRGGAATEDDPKGAGSGEETDQANESGVQEAGAGT
nr:DEAD-box ATP-dependent RNA helicase 42 isoform X7 [Drosophila suzukii]